MIKYISPMNCGSVKLARAIARDDFSFFSLSNNVVNEWDAASGGETNTRHSGHRDAIPGFSTCSATDGLRQSKGSGRGAVSFVGGTITCPWDGTVRLRRLSCKCAR